MAKYLGAFHMRMVHRGSGSRSSEGSVRKRVRLPSKSSAFRCVVRADLTWILASFGSKVDKVVRVPRP